MKPLIFSVLLAALAAPTVNAQTSLPADTAHFTIAQGSHPVGRTDFSIQPIQQGPISTPAAYSIVSHGTLSLPNTKYSFSGSGSLDRELSLVQQNLNGIVNGQAVTFAVHPSGQNLVIEISASGRSYRNSLSRPAETVFFPDFDLAAYEVLLTLTAQHPGTPISALIPKQTGILSAATLAPQSDVPATLAGKAFTVHHASLTIGSVSSELYYSAANHILEVDIPEQTFAVVRENFQLQQPPPPPPNTESQQSPNSSQPQ